MTLQQTFNELTGQNQTMVQDGEYTAETVNEPRERLTKDTKLKLSQIKREEVADKRYKPGEISEKTGLQKQSDGSWAPPKGGNPAGGKRDVPAGSTGSSGVKRPSEAEVTKMRKEKAELDEKSDAIWHDRINLTLNSSDKEMESRGAKLIDSREFGTDGINKTYELPNGDRYVQMYKKTNGNYLGGSLHRADKNPEWRGSWKPGDTSVLKHTKPNVYRDNVTLNTVNEYMELFGYKPIGQKTNPGSWEGTIKVYETPDGKIEENSFNKNGVYAGGSIHYKENYEYERLDKTTGDAAPRELTGDTRLNLSQVKDARRTYKIGEISEKTGLQKQPDGSWAPPKSTEYGKVTTNKEGKVGIQQTLGKGSKFEEFANEKSARRALANLTAGYNTTERSKQDPHSDKARQQKQWNKEVDKIKKENKADRRAERAAEFKKAEKKPAASKKAENFTKEVKSMNSQIEQMDGYYGSREGDELMKKNGYTQEGSGKYINTGKYLGHDSMTIAQKFTKGDQAVYRVYLSQNLGCKQYLIPATEENKDFLSNLSKLYDRNSNSVNGNYMEVKKETENGDRVYSVYINGEKKKSFSYYDGDSEAISYGKVTLAQMPPKQSPSQPAPAAVNKPPVRKSSVNPIHVARGLSRGAIGRDMGDIF